jgi:hypothetical protein
MKPIYITSLIISTLVAFWVYLTIGNPHFKLIPWVGFVSWAAYFAAGGNTEAAKSTFVAGLTGLAVAAITLFLVQKAGGSLTSMMILFPILAFILVSMAQLKNFSYTPGAFLGAACLFGTGGNIDISLLFLGLSWIAGIILGVASVQLNKVFTVTN